MSNSIEIPFGDKKLVAATLQPNLNGFGEPGEIEVFVEDDAGHFQQMICVIRQNFFTKIGDTIEYLLDDSSVQLNVWEDGYAEEPTTNLYVDMIDDEEDDNE